ncbi:hypothetical protein G7Y79_00040g076820 [Physcia stellaris]|nr:hypothetical protein G7Y79_00040g076820 [Physcia stellaris]
MSSSLRIIDYLETLPGVTKNQLYKQPSTVLAVFRRIQSHLAKTLVMALLYMGRPIPVTDLDSWVRPDCLKEREKTVVQLERLSILSVVSNPGKPKAYNLTKTFAASLRLALVGGGNHMSFGIPCNDPYGDPVSIEELDEYAREQWESVLGFMVGSPWKPAGSKGVELSEAVTKLLQGGGLIDMKTKKITRAGFAFLLQDVNAQVWEVLMLYLEGSSYVMQMDKVEVLSFLFMLGSLELGQSYDKSNLTETQSSMVGDLTEFGIILDEESSPVFYPTRLATTLTSDAGALRSAISSTTVEAGTPGFIVLETNYRIYAYTSSALQIAILQLFSTLKVRYPNMIAGKITRDSVRRAVSQGITADQIISFLDTHAHPQMRKTNPVLPPTVVDQIRLWQIEGERMATTEGYLFREFEDYEEYERTVNYARDVGVLLWKNNNKKLFFVDKVQQIASFVKAEKARKAAEGRW